MAGLAGYEAAKADAIAKASGLALADVVRIAPLLDPTPAAVRAAKTDDQAAVIPPVEPLRVPAPVAGPASQPVAVLVPALTRPAPVVGQLTPVIPVTEAPAEVEDQAVIVEQPIPAAPGAVPAVSAASVALVAVAPRPVVEADPRELPVLPEGPAGARFEAVTTGLVSKRPNFVQQARSTVFLDAAAGDLAVRDRVVRLDLGARTPGEILDTVLSIAPGTERIYITAGAPWHDGSERYSTLKDAVAAWLNTPSERWTMAADSGRDKLAWHLRPPAPAGRPLRPRRRPGGAGDGGPVDGGVVRPGRRGRGDVPSGVHAAVAGAAPALGRRGPDGLAVARLSRGDHVAHQVLFLDREIHRSPYRPTRTARASGCPVRSRGTAEPQRKEPVRYRSRWVWAVFKGGADDRAA
ncbi:hypothetical protein K353_06180 [Kitasatospora sp. SolWspMP-SS2h]|uniref:hypothetical protein n=1 Tax=Kitasatospora sp. SolWspMP-SS2h TaxID=1305729 RepID=UPI000DBFEA7D|nr:hypothetical protein [Kitasatospora sp. SolWspMP-SS2h]RAJ31276.1 hypothetical protein K353_06180 [Kitasatospora sp. SolWspMP-SS2h]